MLPFTSSLLFGFITPIPTEPLFFMIYTCPTLFDTLNISCIESSCFKLKAVPEPVLLISNCSVVYTSVFSVVVSPSTTKLLLMVRFPSIKRSSVYLLSIMNFLFESDSWLISSVFNWLILLFIVVFVFRLLVFITSCK